MSHVSQKLAAAVALALTSALPLAADAAGLGRLTVQSALGQPLRAEVEITSLSKEESSSLTARLATADAFRQAGLEYSPALSSLRFAVDRRSDGRAFVRISSSQPINEPFVDMLVELNWASGRFVREYTFLLDPPELRVARESVDGRPAPAAVVPPVAQAQPVAVEAAPVPAPAAAPAQPARPRAATPAPAAAAPSTAPSAAPAARESNPGQVVVRRGDTLASVAGKVKPAEVSLEQAVVAIYRANPAAFLGNMNLLRSGSTLSIPDSANMSSVDAAEAKKEIRVSAADFNRYKSRLAAAPRSLGENRAGQSAGGAVTGQVDDRAAPPSSGDRLRLSKSEAPEGESATGVGAGKGAAAKAAERRVASDAALKESQSRVGELEKNVADLQKLLELKNKQLGDMQKQVEDAKAAGATASGTVTVPPVAVKPPEPPKVEAPKVEPKVEPPKAEAPKVEPKVEPPKAEAPKVEPPKVEPPKAEAPKVEPPPVAVTPEPPKVEAPKAEAPKADPAKSAVRPSEPSFFDELLSNPLVLLGGGAVVLLGGLLGFTSLRRKKKVEKFEDSLVAADAFTANSLFGSTGGQTVDTNNSLFTSKLPDSSSDIQATEVDPIAEAEVYIAYGREAQAEEILKEAIKKQPERQAIRVKLLEIYAGRKDANSFGVVANEMYEMTGGQNEEWPKVVTMGLAIDPANPLYTGKAAAPGGDSSPMGSAAMGALGAAGAAAAGAAIADDHHDQADAYDAPMDEPQALADEPAFDVEPPAIQAEAPMFDEPPAIADDVVRASPVFPDTQPMPSGGAGLEPSPDSDFGALDFNLDIDTKIVAQDDVAGAADRSELEAATEGKFELPSLELPTLDFENPAAGAADSLHHAASEVRLDPGHTPIAEAFKSSEDSALDLSSIGLSLDAGAAPAGVDGERWQEMATKLDLASAYEEIGDKEGARELLEEVLRGGDDSQQDKARELLAKIS